MNTSNAYNSDQTHKSNSRNDSIVPNLPQNEQNVPINSSATRKQKVKNFIRKRTNRQRRKSATSFSRRRNTVNGDTSTASLSETSQSTSTPFQPSNMSQRTVSRGDSNNTTPEKVTVRATQSSAQILRRDEASIPQCNQPEGASSQLSCSMGFLSREKRSISDPKSDNYSKIRTTHAQQSISVSNSKTGLSSVSSGKSNSTNQISNSNNQMSASLNSNSQVGNSRAFDQISSTQTSQSTLIQANSVPMSSVSMNSQLNSANQMNSNSTSNNSTAVRIPDRYSCILLKRRKWPLKGWHRRYFVLYRGVLEYGKDKQTVEQQGKLHGRIELHTVVFHNDAKHKKINIDSGKTVYHMKAKDLACYRESALAFKQHIEYARAVKFNISIPMNHGLIHGHHSGNILGAPVFGNNSIRSPENPGWNKNMLEHGQMLQNQHQNSNLTSEMTAEHCLGFINDGIGKIESLKSQTNSLAILARNAGTYLEVMSTHKGSKWSRSRSSKSNKKWSKDQDFDSNVDIAVNDDQTLVQNTQNNAVSTNPTNSHSIYASQPNLSETARNSNDSKHNHQAPLTRFDSQGNIESSMSDPIHTGLTPTQVADELRSRSQELQHSFILLQNTMLNIKSYVEMQNNAEISQKTEQTSSSNVTPQNVTSQNITHQSPNSGSNSSGLKPSSINYARSKSNQHVSINEESGSQADQMQNALQKIIEIANLTLGQDLQFPTSQRQHPPTLHSEHSENSKKHENKLKMSSLPRHLVGSQLHFSSNSLNYRHKIVSTNSVSNISKHAYDSQSELFHDALSEFYVVSSEPEMGLDDELTDTDTDDGAESQTSSDNCSEVSDIDAEFLDEHSAANNSHVSDGNNVTQRVPTSNSINHSFSSHQSKSSSITPTNELSEQSCENVRTTLPMQKSDQNINLWAILKPLIGKDFTKVALPVILNEPLGALQRCCEDLEYYELLDQASETSDNLERMVLITLFALSSYNNTQFRAGTKPFNPLLGETFEYQNSSFKFLAEQVSHHPPLSASYAESVEKADGLPKWRFSQVMRYKTKFWGRSMELHPQGTNKLTIGDQVYEFNKVTTGIQGIISGPRVVSNYGDLIVSCKRTGLEAKVTFEKDSGGWFAGQNGSPGIVNGKIYETHSSSKTLEFVKGSWMGEIRTRTKHWQPKQLPENSESYYGFTSHAINLNNPKVPKYWRVLPPTDCRARPDQRAMEHGDLELAESEKLRLEQMQRTRRAERAEYRIKTFKPKWFKEQVHGDFVFIDDSNDYWSRKSENFDGDDFEGPLW